MKMLLLLALMGQAPNAQAPEPEAPAWIYYQVPEIEAPGTRIYAYHPEGHRLPMLSDMFAYREWEKAIVAGDSAGLVELERAGRRFTVASETALLMIEHRGQNRFLNRTLAYEVRVLDGEHAGKKGYIPATFIFARRHPEPARPKPPTVEQVKADPEGSFDASLRATREKDQKRKAAAQARRRAVDPRSSYRGRR